MAEPGLVDTLPRWMVGSATESGRRVPIGSGQGVPVGAEYQIWPTGGLPRPRSIIAEAGRAHSTRNTVTGDTMEELTVPRQDGGTRVRPTSCRDRSTRPGTRGSRVSVATGRTEST
jgi:hypothetical protein